MSGAIIPYDQKVDICLDSLQTFVASFEALKNDVREKHHQAYDDHDPEDHIMNIFERLSCKHLVALETQAAVNKAMLELLESMMEDAYPRAQRR
jgi:hypothetical protein